MEEYYWDKKIEYLKNSRYLYHNDDYFEFLVTRVWNFPNPVHIVDFGCGAGYLGLKLLPILHKGSKYTGVDKGQKLIQQAKEIFSELPYETEFINGDITEIELKENSYDAAICHALLLHVVNPKKVISKMIRNVKEKGKVICIEPHWNSAMANFYVNELELSKTVNLGILQKLYENDRLRTGKDGNIGIRIPIYMRELGLTEVGSRVSDCVRYLNSDMNKNEKEVLHKLLCDEGFGAAKINEEDFIRNLVNRGLSINEANELLEIIKYSTEQFSENGLNFNAIFAPTMIISYGTKV